MNSSKLVKITSSEEGAVFASVRSCFVGANKKVISIIGMHSRGKSTLLNQIIGQTAPFFVHPDPLIAYNPTTKGIDFYDDGRSIFLDSEGTNTINNQDNNLDHMILLSTTSISNIIILITKFTDISDSRSFCRESLLALFISNMNINDETDTKKLIVVIRGGPKCPYAIEKFQQFINEIWSLAYEKYLEIYRRARNEEEKQEENEERKQERDLQSSFECYFDLKVLRMGKFLDDTRYEVHFIQEIRAEINNWNREMRLDMINDSLNRIATDFNQKALPDPKTILMITLMLERVRNNILEDCKNQDSEIVARDIENTIENRKNIQRDRLLYGRDLNDTGRIYLDKKLTEMYRDQLLKLEENFINYRRAQIKYYNFAIDCVNVNYQENRDEIYVTTINEYKHNIEREIRRININPDLREKIIERSNIFANKMQKKIESSIFWKKAIEVGMFTIAAVGIVVSVGSAAYVSLATGETEVARHVGVWVVRYLAAGGGGLMGIFANERLYTPNDQVCNLNLHRVSSILRRIEKLYQDKINLFDRLRRCNGPELVKKLDEKIDKERPREFFKFGLENIFNS